MKWVPNQIDNENQDLSRIDFFSFKHSKMQSLRRHWPSLPCYHTSHSLVSSLTFHSALVTVAGLSKQTHKDVRPMHLEEPAVWNKDFQSWDANTLNVYFRVWSCAWVINTNLIHRLKQKNKRWEGKAWTESVWHSFIHDQIERKMHPKSGHIQSSLWYLVSGS